MNALGQAIAQQQFNALVDLCTYEELYAFFGGAGSALWAVTWGASSPSIRMPVHMK